MEIIHRNLLTSVLCTLEKPSGPSIFQPCFDQDLSNDWIPITQILPLHFWEEKRASK